MNDSTGEVPSRSISTSLLRDAKNGDQIAWARLVNLFHSISRNVANAYYKSKHYVQLDSHALNLIPDHLDDEETRNEGVELLNRVLDLISGDFQEKTIEVFRKSALVGRDTNELASEYGMKKSAIREAKRRVMAHLREECFELLGQGAWPWQSADTEKAIDGSD